MRVGSFAHRRLGNSRTTITLGVVGLLASLVGASILWPGGPTGALRSWWDDERPGRSVPVQPRPTPVPQAAPVLVPAPCAEPAAVASPPTAVEPKVIARIHGLIRRGGLGNRSGVFVADSSTRKVRLAVEAARPRTPASLAKLPVSAAALLALGPQARLRTRAVAGRDSSEVVLVGGGDATLTMQRRRRGEHPRRAGLVELARATAARLQPPRGAVTVRIDDTLFTGPAVSPAWRSTYVRSGVVAPVSALMVDGGRVRRVRDERERDPALAAGRHFARLLAREGVAVRGRVTRTTAPPDAQPLASVASPPLTTLVEMILTSSDNDLAESLARHAARARGLPASFRGVGIALPRILSRAGLSTEGLRLLDGSGLARGSKMSAEFVGQLLLLAARDSRLRPLLTGLPVAGFSGTLAQRFRSDPRDGGAGLVRAKTGTLSGVVALAGMATTPSGACVVFAVIADDVQPGRALRTRRTLDRLATLLNMGVASPVPPSG